MAKINLPATAQVLAVDDNASALAAISDMLHELTGQPPLTANGYTSTVAVLNEYKLQHNYKVDLSHDRVIALVVLDQDLSQTSEDLKKVGIDNKSAGLHLITRVRSLAPFAAVGILTAFRRTDEDLGPEAGQAGTDFYLSKSADDRNKTIEKLTNLLAAFGQRVTDYNNSRKDKL